MNEIIGIPSDDNEHDTVDAKTLEFLQNSLTAHLPDVEIIIHTTDMSVEPATDE